jgi:hypothetical protein
MSQEAWHMLMVLDLSTGTWNLTSQSKLMTLESLELMCKVKEWLPRLEHAIGWLWDVQHRAYTLKVDVYSFGIVSWEVITCMFPLKHDSSRQHLHLSTEMFVWSFQMIVCLFSARWCQGVGIPTLMSGHPLLKSLQCLNMPRSRSWQRFIRRCSRVVWPNQWLHSDPIQSIWKKI